MAYKPRLTAPTTSDKHWISTSKGGYNRCIVIDSKTGSVLPNCVGYAWGRFMEVLGKAPTLSRANAENWWDYNDGWEPPATPALWTEVAKPGEILPWKQPEGAHDAYQTGDKVYYPDTTGSIWISLVDNNVWEPGVYGWQQE